MLTVWRPDWARLRELIVKGNTAAATVAAAPFSSFRRVERNLFVMGWTPFIAPTLGGAVRASSRSPQSQLLNRGGWALLGSAKIHDRRCLFGITPEWGPASPCPRSFCVIFDQVARVRSIRRAAEDLPAERGLDVSYETVPR